MAATAIALLEREKELATIESVLSEAGTGSGGVVLFEGEAGAGKTSLLKAAAEHAARREMLVLRARGGEYERDFPHGVVRQLFEPLLREPQRRAELLSGSAGLATPVFEPEAEPVEAGAVEHGLYWLAADIAAAAPLLLVVDDAQWADVASLRSLGYLARRLDGLAVALVLAVRSGEPGAREDLLDELRTEAGGRVLRPAPLSASAAGAIVAGETGTESSERVAEAYREATGGNPFLVAELARALGGAELEPGDEGIECLDRVAAAGIGHSIRARLARLGEAAVELARAVAVLEPNAEPHSLAALTGLTPEAITEASELLIGGRLLDDAESPTFVHPLVREAVLSEIPAPRRAALHAGAARLLDEAGTDLDAVAAQLLLAAPLGDPWAVAELRAAAADALGRGAAEAAVRYLRRALREPPPREQRPVASRELGVALLRANDPEGIEVLRAVRAGSEDVRVRAEIATELASSLSLRGGNEEAAGLLEASLDKVAGIDGGLELLLRAWLLIQSVWGLERVAEGALPKELPSSDSLPGRFLLQGIASVYVLGFGPVQRGLQAARAVVARSELIFADAQAGMPPQGALIALVLADRGDLIEGLFDIAIEGARQRGVFPGVGGGHGGRAFAHLLEGRLRESQADAETAVSVLARYGLAAPVALWSMVLAWALIGRGELREAERVLESFSGGKVRLSGSPGAALLCVRGHLRATLGRHAEARHDFLAASERIAWLPYPNPDIHPWRLGLARCEAALGNQAEAREMAAEAVRLAREAGMARGIGMALRTEGIVAGGAPGIELLAEAVEALGATRARLHYAEALVEYGAALRRANFRKDAREPLREGLELARRCGAAALEDCARTELAASGARPRKAVFTGVDALTPSELRVARMAAGEMTNREIAQSLTVTQKTVETHMRHVFQKLDVAKRTELAAALSPEGSG